MLSEDRVGFFMEVNMDDFVVLHAVARRLNQTPQKFVMDAVKNYLVKIQEEANAPGEIPEPMKGEEKEEKTVEKKIEPKEGA